MHWACTSTRKAFPPKKRGVKKPNHCGYDELVIHKAAVAPAFAVKVNNLNVAPPKPQAMTHSSGQVMYKAA